MEGLLITPGCSYRDKYLRPWLDSHRVLYPCTEDDESNEKRASEKDVRDHLSGDGDRGNWYGDLPDGSQWFCGVLDGIIACGGRKLVSRLRLEAFNEKKP